MIARLRGKRAATTDKNRGAPAAMTSITGTFLTVGLGSATADFAAGLRALGTGSPRCELETIRGGVVGCYPLISRKRLLTLSTALLVRVFPRVSTPCQ